jgi:hypothetical protein
MRRLFRPPVLVALLAALVVGAAALVYQTGGAPARAAPLPVGAGDVEVAWLYYASNAGAWQRFVTAVRRAADRLRAEEPGAAGPPQEGAAFPPQTTATPEVALTLPGEGRRVVFRWYKLTSEAKTADWVAALTRRRPPPLAVIGGNTSDEARELAWQLRQDAAGLPEAERPLLLLTTATAEQVADPAAASDGAALIGLYPGRTFRFCFTNEQMARAVTRFIFAQADLRPDADPVYTVRWKDDEYSRDLVDRFLKALEELADGEGGRDAGPAEPFRLTRLSPPFLIDSSVGTFLTPNRYEAKNAAELLAQARDGPRRPLLVVSGQSAPSRRFLRALARMDPEQARRFVVATGDSLSFNTVYRDRRVAWPVQDLPFRVVFFCHYDPVDPGAGFRPDGAAPDPDRPGASATGTEDVLLNSDIVEALLRAYRRGGVPAAGAGELRDRLRELRLREGALTFEPDGRRLFDERGNRKDATGEHVVCLRPQFDGTRVLPRAAVEVWAGRRERGGQFAWQRRGGPLVVSYVDAPEEGGAGP